MKVAVNLLWLASGRVGGSEEYLTRQLAGLEPDGFELDLFVDGEFAAAHSELASRHRVVPMPFDAGGRPARIVLEHTWLAMRSRRADVVHHGGGTSPVLGPGPRVLTVHDIQYRTFPQYFSRSRRAYLASMMPRSVRSAAVTAVPSEFVRGEVVDAFGVDADRVVVVPHGVPKLERPDDASIAEVRRRLGIGDRPYVVYPAITHPHKAHGLLVDAVDHLDDDMVLVLLGGTGAAEERLARNIAGSAHRDRIIRPGRVVVADRDALIADAAALAFPSEFEGFGAPVVEAMQLDTPVVCSSAAALTEVVSDAGIIVGEPTAEAWAAGIGEAIGRADELVAAGRQRREAFTIELSGRSLASAYRLAAS